MRGLFFLAALLPPDLETAITGFKADLAALCDTHAALRQPAHIALTETFAANAARLPLLKAELEKQFAVFSPFTTGIRNFAALPAELRIIAAIEDQEKFLEMREALFWFNKTTRLLGPKAVRTTFFRPQVILAAEDLTEDHFYLAWEKYRQLQYSATFPVDRIHLMHHRKQWLSVHEFPLAGQPTDHNKQLRLF